MNISGPVAEVADEPPIDAVGMGQIVQRPYGARPEEIVENVIHTWLANGAQDEDPGGLWVSLTEDAWAPPL
ncbi:hypothetical protein [Microvirga yunnanensis]|uniref:hypothetical protein n=1 Tax=Microvirga yunnanensis TaxID=2953740 RepID=UPI0021C6D60E|nr:hypothetical protein [Microvirga sp. HBU65207]